ncbi:Rhodanese-like domain-containing protein [Zostera marina]|uniref:Rhodanese-like domain-containing protein n=1 Tax=Zostera marina TaxID=29655 RepID=A0A0K9PF88_ZOSMR|nr:Rhodanese-like domain-containing protein [Zostera marina]
MNIPYLFFTPQGRVKNPDFLEIVLETCNKNDFIVVSCASGARSLQATKELLSAGFKHVKNMGGGYSSWIENGFLVNKPNIPILVQST